MTVLTPPAPRRDAVIVRLLEQTIFASRWLLAPIYLGLALGLVDLLIKFVQHLIELFTTVVTTSANEVTVGVLSLLELSFVANLVIIVMFAGYENFVSTFNLADHPDKPVWLGHVGLSDLKLRLIASLVAVAAMQLLEDLMHVTVVTNREIGWSIGITLTFVLAGVLLAITDRITEPPGR